MVDDPAMMIGLAFVLGYLVRQIGLPPLVGFLAAGFILRGFWGVEFTDGIGQVADLGVTLMLFTIGLKLKARDLGETPVWLGSTIHMLASIAIFYPPLIAGAHMGVPFLGDLDWGSAAIIAFAMSFSSTVFAVVMFQTKGETNADYAKTAIGILIMQDIFAVIFLSASKGITPSLWAIPLIIGLITLRKPMAWLLRRSGHGELLILSGLLLPLATYELFEMVQLKGDLGALFVGVLLAGSKKADELSKLLFSFKEFLLVTFFLSIGLRGDPSMDMLLIALAMVLLLPIKAAFFYHIMTRLNLMARPATFATLSLSNYSEFGLIVGALATSKGWISPDWLLIFALALSISYIITGPAYMRAERLFERFASWLHRFERPSARPPRVYLEDKPILVVGMGRMGTATCRQIMKTLPKGVIGLDFDSDTVDKRREQGFACLRGDGGDREFWERADLSDIQAILVTMPNQVAGRNVVIALREAGYEGFIGVTTAHNEDNDAMIEAGASATHSIYEGAAETFSEVVCQRLQGPAQERVTLVETSPGTTA